MKKLLIYLLPIMSVAFLQCCSKEEEDDDSINQGYECILGTCGTTTNSPTYSTLADCQADCEKRDAKLMVYLEQDCNCGSVTVLNPYVGDDLMLMSYINYEPECGNTAAAIFDVRSGQVQLNADCPLKDWSHTINVSPNTCVKVKLKCDESISVTSSQLPTGGGGGGGGGGGTGNCSGSYQSPTPNDAQLDALCQAAYTYRCGGYDSQADLTCAQYQQLAATGTNVPRCSYCN